MEAIGAAESIVAILRIPVPVAGARNRRMFAHTPVAMVRFESVGFAYSSERVVDDIDFSIARGRRVALVGPSGAGKSTIGQLLLGFLDRSGAVREILVDANGVEPCGVATVVSRSGSEAAGQVC